METEAGSAPRTEDDAIRTVVSRLSRPHPSGGQVIERAAILAEGACSSDVLKWVVEHGGEPEELPAAKAERGLHSARINAREADTTRKPLRYVLPPEAA